MIALSPRDLRQVIRTAERYRLDFDDAYQLVAAEKLDLTVVSFDSHFDKTERGRKTPAQATKETMSRVWNTMQTGIVP